MKKNPGIPLMITGGLIAASGYALIFHHGGLTGIMIGMCLMMVGILVLDESAQAQVPVFSELTQLQAAPMEIAPVTRLSRRVEFRSGRTPQGKPSDS
jgi:hypothetical protein